MVWGAGKGSGKRWDTHWVLLIFRSQMAVPGCDEKLAEVCKHCSSISTVQPKIQRCETNYIWRPWPLRSCPAKVAKGFTLCAQMQGVFPFLKNEGLKIPSCQKFIGCNWFLPFKTLKNLHLSLAILNGVHLSLLCVCKPWAWWISVPGLCCSTAKIYIYITI